MRWAPRQWLRDEEPAIEGQAGEREAGGQTDVLRSLETSPRCRARIHALAYRVDAALDWQDDREETQEGQQRQATMKDSAAHDHGDVGPRHRRRAWLTWRLAGVGDLLSRLVPHRAPANGDMGGR